MKTGRVSDGLKMIRVARVSIRSRYRRMLAGGYCWNRLRETVAEIWIFCATAIAGVSGGVYRKLHQVC
jgi:hypothetical protein